MNIKRLVLGTAAGALAVTGAQAADLPVVVEPVEYVRICDAYGTGFYYIPGTETCLRVAGRIRADYQFFGDLSADGGDYEITNRGYDRDNERGYRFRARAYLYLDSRTSTEFGLLRTFTELQWNWEDGNSFQQTDVERAFIQFGGLTFGNTRSFWDYSDAFFGSQFFWEAPTSDHHTMVAAYTAAFGNGFSASLSIEDSSSRQLGIQSDIDVGSGDDEAYDKTAWVPDLVANIRVDQGWGSAQIMGFVGYREAGRLNGNGIYSDSESEIAYGVGGGVTINVPFGTDTTVGIQAAYSHGSAAYVNETPVADVIDGYWNDASGNFDLTDAFSVAGGFSTSFTPALSYTLGGGYAYYDQANDSDAGDIQSITVDGMLSYEIVSGFVFAGGLQYKYVDTDHLGDGNALAGFLRAQRTF
ncbi:porin [Acuticoccus sediminis]|uniref:Porin n=1 Tax=Acuticoccus sediminis TaxID=2184697 RepID=A0A8B2P1I1_9HYPH|nr:porin [Acuticoccus sediminis]RAI02992.1 porin [Acuticoccus sediminis]